MTVYLNNDVDRPTQVGVEKIVKGLSKKFLVTKNVSNELFQFTGLITLKQLAIGRGSYKDRPEKQNTSILRGKRMNFSHENWWK